MQSVLYQVHLSDTKDQTLAIILQTLMTQIGTKTGKLKIKPETTIKSAAMKNVCFEVHTLHVMRDHTNVSSAAIL